MNNVSNNKRQARKPTQTFSTDYKNFLLTVNIQKLTKIKNVTLVAKLLFVKQKIKYQQTLTVTGFSNVICHTPNGTPV